MTFFLFDKIDVFFVHMYKTSSVLSDEFGYKSQCHLGTAGTSVFRSSDCRFHHS